MDTLSSHSVFNYKVRYFVAANLRFNSSLSQVFETVVVASLKFIFGGISLSSIFATRFYEPTRAVNDSDFVV